MRGGGDIIHIKHYDDRDIEKLAKNDVWVKLKYYFNINEYIIETIGIIHDINEDGTLLDCTTINLGDESGIPVSHRNESMKLDNFKKIFKIEYDYDHDPKHEKSFETGNIRIFPPPNF
jgi:hypothetical protein